MDILGKKLSLAVIVAGLSLMGCKTDAVIAEPSSPAESERSNVIVSSSENHNLTVHSSVKPVLNSGLTWGQFELYQKNEKQGIGNYITEDFLLLSYSMLREVTISQLELEHIRPLQTQLLSKIHTALIALKPGEITAGNIAFIDLLRVLAGEGGTSKIELSKIQKQELDLVMSASSVNLSPLWEVEIDYSQFKPRGRYTQHKDLETYFRSMAYASAILFPVKSSLSTGLTESQANLRTAQALQFAEMFENNASLADQYYQFNQKLEWRFGASDDLGYRDLLAVRDAFGAAKPIFGQYRDALLQYASEHNKQPQIIGGLLNIDRLAEGETASQVMTGWRLLPSRYTPESAAIQKLVFNSTGEYKPTKEHCENSFGVSYNRGRAVKGFPMADELLALLGSEVATQRLVLFCEQDFDGYEDAFTAAKDIIKNAKGLSATQLMLMRKWLTEERVKDSDRVHTTLKSFWTYQRYLGVLYQKQSNTPTSKGLFLPPKIKSAWIEPAVPLYLALSHLVDEHRTNTPNRRWDAFYKLLAECIRISRKELQGVTLSEEEVGFLNNLDNKLKRLVGKGDVPIVVDIHTDGTSGQVVQEAIGFANPIEHSLRNGAKVRGALFTHYEFKQPLADRLNNDTWLEQLVGKPKSKQGGQP